MSSVNLVVLYARIDSLYRHAASDVHTGVVLYRIHTGAEGCNDDDDDVDDRGTDDVVAAAGDPTATPPEGSDVDVRIDDAPPSCPPSSAVVVVVFAVITDMTTIDVGQSESTAAVTAICGVG
jgi:hypothetical protein